VCCEATAQCQVKKQSLTHEDSTSNRLTSTNSHLNSVGVLFVGAFIVFVLEKTCDMEVCNFGTIIRANLSNASPGLKMSDFEVFARGNSSQLFMLLC
jgi:hypothetical protein